jgi:hypothetical protein
LNPATGSAVLFGLGLEPEYGVPGGILLGYRGILPIKADLVGEESESKAVNQSGLIEPSLPGPKGGKHEFKIPMTVAAMLEFLEHVCRGVEKTQLEVGPPAVYQYVFAPDIAGVDTSFFGILTKPPVERWYLHGIKFGSIAAEIGDNAEIPLTIKGEISHGTRLGVAIAEAGNTGTYSLGPHIRGPLKDRTAGSVWVKVTQVAPSLQFKIQQSVALPAFAGVAVDVAIDPETSRAVWQNVQGHTGADLGIWDVNKDPLEIIFPGAAADHGDIEVGDVWHFPVTWNDPAVTFLTGYQEFTSAHWQLQLREAGAVDWLVKRVNTGSFELAWAVTPDRGGNSRYPFGITRDGFFTPSVEANRRLADDFFINAAERRIKVQALLSFLGRQIGTGVHRESLTLEIPNGRIDEGTRDAASEKVIPEKVKLTGERDGGATVTVITTRNWTPSA